VRNLFYLIGVPGAGKSTIFQRALKDIPVISEPRPFLHCVYPGGVQLGGLRESFSGTDTLPMNVQPNVLHWLSTTTCANIVAEGDRLANGQFFDAVVAQGWRLTVASLELPASIAATRRESRRSYQNPSWVRGRGTKVTNLVRAYVRPEWRMNALDPIDLLAKRLGDHPAFKGLPVESRQA